MNMGWSLPTYLPTSIFGFTITTHAYIYAYMHIYSSYANLDNTDFDTTSPWSWIIMPPLPQTHTGLFTPSPKLSGVTAVNGSSAKSGAVCRGEEGKLAGGKRFLPLCLRSVRQPPR